MLLPAEPLVLRPPLFCEVSAISEEALLLRRCFFLPRLRWRSSLPELFEMAEAEAVTDEGCEMDSVPSADLESWRRLCLGESVVEERPAADEELSIGKGSLPPIL